MQRSAQRQTTASTGHTAPGVRRAGGASVATLQQLSTPGALYHRRMHVHCVQQLPQAQATVLPGMFRGGTRVHHPHVIDYAITLALRQGLTDMDLMAAAGVHAKAQQTPALTALGALRHLTHPRMTRNGLEYFLSRPTNLTLSLSTFGQICTRSCLPLSGACYLMNQAYSGRYYILIG